MMEDRSHAEMMEDRFLWDEEEDFELGLEDGTPNKVEAWKNNKSDGKYLIGIDAERVIVRGMRRRLSQMRELISPNMSAANSLFEFPIKDGNQQGQELNSDRSAITERDLTDELCPGKLERKPSLRSLRSNVSKQSDGERGFSSSQSCMSLRDVASWQGVGALKDVSLRTDDQYLGVKDRKKSFSSNLSNSSRSSSVSNFCEAKPNQPKLRGPPVNVFREPKEIEEPKISDGKKKIASKIDNGKRKKDEVPARLVQSTKSKSSLKETLSLPTKGVRKDRRKSSSKEEEEEKPEEVEIPVAIKSDISDCTNDAERFEYYFHQYSKWGGQDNCGFLSLSQLSKWFKNVGIIDGKKVTTIEIAHFFNSQHASERIPRSALVKFVQAFAKEKSKVKGSDTWKMKLVQVHTVKID